MINILVQLTAGGLAGISAMMNGGNDVANTMTACVKARTLTFSTAAILAGISNFLGAVLMSKAVTGAIRKNIVNLNVFKNTADGVYSFVMVMLSALSGHTILTSSATRLGSPISSTQSILGAIVGASIAHAGTDGVQWYDKSGLCHHTGGIGFKCGGLFGIVVQCLFAPLIACILAIIIYRICYAVLLGTTDENVTRRAPPFLAISSGVVFFMLFWFILVQQTKDQSNGMICFIIFLGVSIMARILFYCYPRMILPSTAAEPLIADAERQDPTVGNNRMVDNHNSVAEYTFGMAQVFTALLGAFAHGANDISNEVAPLAAILSVLENGITDNVDTPIWIYVFAGSCLALGIRIFGEKVMETVGDELTHQPLTAGRGFSIELGFSLASIIASEEGWPISTTQLAIGAIVGVSMVSGRGCESINWTTMGKIFAGWLATPVCSGLLGWLIYLVISLF